MPLLYAGVSLLRYSMLHWALKCLCCAMLMLNEVLCGAGA